MKKFFLIALLTLASYNLIAKDKVCSEFQECFMNMQKISQSVKTLDQLNELEKALEETRGNLKAFTTNSNEEKNKRYIKLSMLMHAIIHDSNDQSSEECKKDLIYFAKQVNIFALVEGDKESWFGGFKFIFEKPEKDIVLKSNSAESKEAFRDELLRKISILKSCLNNK